MTDDPLSDLERIRRLRVRERASETAQAPPGSRGRRSWGQVFGYVFTCAADACFVGLLVVWYGYTQWEHQQAWRQQLDAAAERVKNRPEILKLKSEYEAAYAEEREAESKPWPIEPIEKGNEAHRWLRLAQETDEALKRYKEAYQKELEKEVRKLDSR